MKVSKVSQPARGMRRAARLFGVLAVIGVALMVISFAYLAYYGRFEHEYSSRAEAVRVLSQTIAKTAAETVDGNLDAFFMLADARAQLEDQIKALTETGPQGGGLLPTAALTEEAERALSMVLISWAQVRDDVDAILERRQQVIAVHELGQRFHASLPELQKMAEGLSDRLLAADAERTQVAQAGRLLLAAERIGRYLEEALRGVDAIAAGERLGASAEALSRGLKALLDGDSALGISAVGDAQARQQLAAIQEAFAPVQAEIDEVLVLAPELFRVRDAADGIFANTTVLLTTAGHFLNRYQALERQRPFRWWHGFAFGGAAILLLLLRSAATRAVNRAELDDRERETARAAELSRRSQEAMLGLLNAIEGLKDDDLTVQATLGEEAAGDIADAFNDAIEALRTLVTTVNQTSAQVSSAASQAQAAVMHLAEASERQAHQVTTVSAAVGQMAASIDQVVGSAQESARVARQSVDLATRCADSVRRAVEGMELIRRHIRETAQRIKRLDESSQEIGNIAELINEITEQTNILALNASIQAATAGEAGRGFVLVADEVQRLAERSGHATRQIEALVATIQADTGEALAAMERSTAGVASGARLAAAAGEALSEIETAARQQADLIRNISVAAQQQAGAVAGIADTMAMIQESAAQASADTSETAASIGSLAALANELQDSVAGFRLSG